MSDERMAARTNGPFNDSLTDVTVVNERTPLLQNSTPAVCPNSEHRDNDSASTIDGSNCSSRNPRENGTHCHRETSEVSRVDAKARRQLIIACILCLIFMIGELTGGILANSLAIATDAAHLLTDFASFLISLFSILLASRPPTKRMSFGWYRAEVMGALLSVLLIWVITGILVYMAVERVISDEYEINATVMLVTAGCGVVFNLMMGVVLHEHIPGHGHGHSYSHSHGGTRASSSASLSRSSSTPRQKSVEAVANDSNGLTLDSVDHQTFATESLEGEAIDLRMTDGRIVIEQPKEKRNINVRAAFIHVVGDLVQSFGVLIAAYIIYYKPEYKLADPICTFVFSILVLFTTITILVDILNVLMEGAPRSVSFNEVKESLCSIEGVKELHNLRLWSLTVNKTALSVHLALDNSVSAQEVLSVAGRLMRDRFGIYECTVQTEEYVEEMSDCVQCQDPKD